MTWRWQRALPVKAKILFHFANLIYSIYHALSERIAHPTVHHHLSQLSVYIQLNGLVKCREDSSVHMNLTLVIFRLLSWHTQVWMTPSAPPKAPLVLCVPDIPESSALRQWTPVITNWINWNASWIHWPRTSHKLQFSQMPNQHQTWAVTFAA